ncbi:MAG: hypothetical protein JWQ27_362 [Ferruginibacter sp.]|nr:hypothetical protein [Ferruginibacter sp.]
MQLRIFKTALVLFFFLGISASLFAQKDKGFNFPPDFGKTETTVLIGEGSKDKISEAMLEAFEKEYGGKFIAEAAADKKKTTDKDQFRYVFFVTEEVQPAQFIGRDRFPATTNYRFGLFDLKTGIRYQTEYVSGAYGKGAKYYVKNLEKFRKDNGGK